MTWRCWLGDTMTGALDVPIDLPSFSWAVSIGDCSLSTTKDKGAGDAEWSGVTVPWTAVPASTPAERASMLSPSRRSLTLVWEDGGGAAPVLWGAIGQRKDTWLDTSFSVDSAMSLLSGRLVVREGDYGSGPGGTSPSSVRLEGLSYRGIASAIVELATSAKPAGSLPIDLPYLGEKGTRAREYRAYDVQHNSASRLLENLANLEKGPDIQFRPYMPDASHVRLRLEAGSDADVYLGQGAVYTLTCFPGGGTIQDLASDHAGPIMRVYGSGSGTDAAQVCHLSEDLALCSRPDPWPLAEAAYSDPDTDSLAVLASHSDARLSSNSRPLVQLSGRVDFSDPLVPRPGTIWPGELVDLAVEGFPTLPDGVHRCRLMEMSGDQSSSATLRFDVMEDPFH